MDWRTDVVFGFICMHVTDCNCMYLYNSLYGWRWWCCWWGWRQEAKRLAEEVNQLHLNTTGPKSGELLALFGSLFIFVCFEALLGCTGHFTSTQRTLQWLCAPRETILQRVQRVLHEDCVIFLQGAQLGMASKPHTGPSNEKSWDSQPFSELDWRMGLQTERSMSVPNCHVNMLAILRSNQHVWIALMCFCTCSSNWVWPLASNAKVWQYLVRLQTVAASSLMGPGYDGRLAYKASISWSIIAEVPDDAPCVSPNLRTILMTAVSTWKKILGEGLRVDWC